jgi:DNA modification methylase
LEATLDAIAQTDCIAGMEALPAGSVDLAFADPPFNIGYDYDVYDDRKDRDHYLDWSRRWISGVARVLRPDGTFWLAIGDEYAAELKLLSQEIGFHCRSWVIWYYTFGVNCSRKFSRSHAHLFYFVKDPQNFTFRENALENRIPSARQLVYGDSRANPFGRLPDDTWILRPQDLADCFTPAEDTWYFPRVAGTFKERAGFHGCQMPEQLLGRIIRNCSHENGVVLDPFSGSATTLVVARKLGRECLGFELSEDYAIRGNRRLGQVRRGDPLEGAAEPNVSAPATPSKSDATRRASQLKPTKTGPAARSSTAAQPPAKLSGRLDSLAARGLIEAFQAASDGYSLDRMIADSDLNRALADACRRSGLPGDVRSWNWSLFRLRKAGLLKHLPTTRRTEISWKDCDRYLFASEIALRQMLDKGSRSVDEVLCDPELAAEFDAIAQSLAPGFAPLEYRWAALKLRKEAKFARSRAKLLAPTRLRASLPVEGLDWQSLPARAGLYLVTGRKNTPRLYAGETLNLRERLERHFGSDPLRQAWNRWAEDLQVRLFPADCGSPELIAYQCRLVKQYKPLLNFEELSAA